jgi:uncharacterized protein (TIGR02231 family)
LQAIKDSLEILQTQESLLNDQKFVLDKEQELILSNGTLNSQQTAVNATTLAEMARYYRTRLSEIRTELAQIETRRAKINQTRARLSHERTQLNANRNQPTHEVVVSYTARVNGPLNLFLKYRAANAGWHPEYDLRLDGNAPEGNLLLRAQVMNNTGIDWKDVRLTLSNTLPQQDNEAPNVEPWYLSVYNPAYYESLSRTRSAYGGVPAQAAPSVRDDREEVAEDYGGGGAEGDYADEQLQATESVASYTTVSQALLAQEYNISLRYDIPADNKPHQVDVQLYKLPVGYEHYAAPKRSQSVFLRASLTQWGQYNLMPGSVQVFFEGSYIGESQLNPGTTDDTLRVSLGRDPQVTILREALTEFTSRKTIGSNVREERAYKITVRNNRRNAIRVRVVETLPVSQDSRIEVEPLQIEGWSRNEANGKLTAFLELQPTASRELQFRFSIKYPKDVTVTGL